MPVTLVSTVGLSPISFSVVNRAKDGMLNCYAFDIYATDAKILLVTLLQTIVELPEFIRRAKAIMGDAERIAPVD